MRAQILTAALNYVRSGLAVFPARPDKKCSYKSTEYSDGRKWEATADPAEIRRDFTRWPNARIGIPTGAINRIVVIEIDTPAGHGVDGAASLAQLEAKHGPLPQTRMACSPSDSIHRCFRHPGNGIKIKNTASVIGAGIDVRGDGGMVIAPPSVNLDGRRYHWINKLPIAAMPAWLIELTKEKPRTISERALAAISNTQRRCVFDAPSKYGAAALNNELTNIGRADVGTRNYVLNRAAFSLGQLVAIGMLDAAEVAQRLFDAAIAWGNPNKDRDVIRHGMQAGMRHPREVPR